MVFNWLKKKKRNQIEKQLEALSIGFSKIISNIEEVLDNEIKKIQ